MLLVWVWVFGCYGWLIAVFEEISRQYLDTEVFAGIGVKIIFELGFISDSSIELPC